MAGVVTLQGMASIPSEYTELRVRRQIPVVRRHPVLIIFAGCCAICLKVDSYIVRVQSKCCWMRCWNAKNPDGRNAAGGPGGGPFANSNRGEARRFS